MKKKLTSILLTAALTLSMSSGFTSVSADDNISVVLNGQKLQFEVEPQIVDGNTMVPMRAIFEALLYRIQWNDTEKSILAYSDLTDLYVKMVIGNKNMTYGYYTELTEYEKYYNMALEISPFVLDGTTLIPIRAVSEASGCDVEWDSATRTVYISTPKRIKDNSEKSIKDYLAYNYTTMVIGNKVNIMRYRIYKNITTTLPYDYVIAMSPVDGITLLKTIKILNTMTNEEKQKIVDAYQGFEEEVAKDIIQQLPTQKFLGSYAEQIGDKYSYLNWSNFGNVVTIYYNDTVAGDFTWADKWNYGNLIFKDENEYKDYFSNVKTNLPWVYKDKLLDKEVTVTDVKFRKIEESATEGKLSAEVAVIGDGYASLLYMNCYDRKGNYLDCTLISVSTKETYSLEFLPKDTSRIVISDKCLENAE